MDGYGYREEKKGNAIAAACPNNIQKLWDHYPHTLLQASGNAVGLPQGQMGNSEVGHLNIGAGRVVDQPLMQINHAIADGTFYQNKALKDVIAHCKKNQSTLHIFGLLSDGGVHSHIDHFYAMLELCREEQVKKVAIHAFLDGRDTLPKISLTFIHSLVDKMEQLGVGKLVDISGRYYSMDRERMWDLTEQYYHLLVDEKTAVITDIDSYIKKAYQQGLTDEFIVPVKVASGGQLKENDGMVMLNFRPDRITQLFTALTNPEFTEFPTHQFKNVPLVTMMSVEHSVLATIAFPPHHLVNTLGSYLASLNKKVLRIAEASKYPHVTYFFDGGEEKDLRGTDKVIIPRKEVATYDLYPSMSAPEITNKLTEIMDSYDVIILNYANCDMVGHTGKFAKVVEAVQAVDQNIGRLYELCKQKGFTMFLTADHGNAEIMEDEHGNIVTAHTTSPVPCIITDKNLTFRAGSKKLGDLAPTILDYLEIAKPKEMTGESLINHRKKD